MNVSEDGQNVHVSTMEATDTVSSAKYNEVAIYCLKLRNEVNRLKGELALVEQQATVRNKLKDDLESKLKRQQQTITQLESTKDELSKKAKKASSLEALVSQLRSEVDSLKESNKELQKKESSARAAEREARKAEQKAQSALSKVDKATSEGADEEPAHVQPPEPQQSQPQDAPDGSDLSDLPPHVAAKVSQAVAMLQDLMDSADEEKARADAMQAERDNALRLHKGFQQRVAVLESRQMRSRAALRCVRAQQYLTVVRRLGRRGLVHQLPGRAGAEARDEAWALTLRKALVRLDEAGVRAGPLPAGAPAPARESARESVARQPVPAAAVAEVVVLSDSEEEEEAPAVQHQPLSRVRGAAAATDAPQRGGVPRPRAPVAEADADAAVVPDVEADAEAEAEEPPAKRPRKTAAAKTATKTDDMPAPARTKRQAAQRAAVLAAPAPLPAALAAAVRALFAPGSAPEDAPAPPVASAFAAVVDAVATDTRSHAALAAAVARAVALSGPDAALTPVQDAAPAISRRVTASAAVAAGICAAAAAVSSSAVAAWDRALDATLGAAPAVAPRLLACVLLARADPHAALLRALDLAVDAASSAAPSATPVAAPAFVALALSLLHDCLPAPQQLLPPADSPAAAIQAYRAHLQHPAAAASLAPALRRATLLLALTQAVAAPALAPPQPCACLVAADHARRRREPSEEPAPEPANDLPVTCCLGCVRPLCLGALEQLWPLLHAGPPPRSVAALEPALGRIRMRLFAAILGMPAPVHGDASPLRPLLSGAPWAWLCVAARRVLLPAVTLTAAARAPVAPLMHVAAEVARALGLHLDGVRRVQVDSAADVSTSDELAALQAAVAAAAVPVVGSLGALRCAASVWVEHCVSGDDYRAASAINRDIQLIVHGILPEQKLV